MLPMGTIVAVCMFIGVLSASGVLKWLPQVLLKILAALVIVAGLWNTFWYGVQHPAEFWGQAALASGALMIIAGLYVLRPAMLPAIFLKIKPLVLVLLLGCGLLYAITIARL